MTMTIRGAVGRLLVGALLFLPATARGDDRFDVGLLLGTTKTGDEGAVLQFRREVTYQATFAWRLWSGPRAAIAIEVPLLASPAFEVTTTGPSLPLEYASLYLTPGVRVTWPVRRPLSVFGTIGAGYARYSESRFRIDTSPNADQRDTNTGAFHVGGGVDVRARRWLGFRAEVRDVITGARAFSIPTPGGTVHNIIPSAGLVLRF
ncbi:MAG: hypothetical protein ABUS56_09820 [Acidobacteriota bacterium]